MSTESRFRWCSEILLKKVAAINKEFVANKAFKPENPTTVGYDKNEPKNRYDDIVCIDATRVILKDRSCVHDEYIHANWVTMPDGQKYICTQAPMNETRDDFWHMVVAEESSVVVVLKHPCDETKDELFPYFPFEKSNKSATYRVSVKEEKEDLAPGVSHQVLEVSGESGTSVVHFLVYEDWRNHTAPDSPVATVELLKKSKELAAEAPITVVSLAGFGRAGTFVGIDFAFQKIESGDFNMVDMINDLREQRMHVIESGVQYVFLHLCLLYLFVEEEVITCGGVYEIFNDNYRKLLKLFDEMNHLID